MKLQCTLTFKYNANSAQSGKENEQEQQVIEVTVQLSRDWCHLPTPPCSPCLVICWDPAFLLHLQLPARCGLGEGGALEGVSRAAGVRRGLAFLYSVASSHLPFFTLPEVVLFHFLLFYCVSNIHRTSLIASHSSLPAPAPPRAMFSSVVWVSAPWPLHWASKCDHNQSNLFSQVMSVSCSCCLRNTLEISFHMVQWPG